MFKFAWNVHTDICLCGGQVERARSLGKYQRHKIKERKMKTQWNSCGGGWTSCFRSGEGISTALLGGTTWEGSFVLLSSGLLTPPQGRCDICWVNGSRGHISHFSPLSLPSSLCEMKKSCCSSMGWVYWSALWPYRLPCGRWECAWWGGVAWGCGWVKLLPGTLSGHNCGPDVNFAFSNSDLPACWSLSV